MTDIGLLGNAATMHNRGGNNSGGVMTTTMGRESRAQEAIRMKDEQLKVCRSVIEIIWQMRWRNLFPH